MENRRKFQHIIISALRFWAKICHLKDAEAGDYAKKFFRAISFGEESGLNFEKRPYDDELFKETYENNVCCQESVDFSSFIEAEREKYKLLKSGRETDEWWTKTSF